MSRWLNAQNAQSLINFKLNDAAAALKALKTVLSTASDIMIPPGETKLFIKGTGSSFDLQDDGNQSTLSIDCTADADGDPLSFAFKHEIIGMCKCCLILLVILKKNKHQHKT